MRGVRFLSTVATMIVLATSASGECASANVHVDVQVSTDDSTPTPAQIVKKSVAEFASIAKGIYTGLIIDCRGLGLQTAMSPTIKNVNGTKIYGHKDLDVDKIIAMGMVDYVNDPEQISRAGTNPLVIRAVALDNFNSDPVVSLEDSNRILVENYATKFLRALKVVFLFD